MRTNAGTDHQSRTSYDPASSGAGAYAPLCYIGLTANSVAPAATDTALTGEITTVGGGLVRALASYAHSNGTNTASLVKVFTINSADVTPTTPAKSAVFSAASAGTMGYEDLISNPPPLVYANGTGDSMEDTWIFTL